MITGMAYNNREIEIQVEVEHIESLCTFLKNYAEKTGETAQLDEYYTPAHKDYRDVRPVVEWLRVRTDDKGMSMCFKNYHVGEDYASNYCDEWETSVGSFDMAKNILLAIGCKKLITVNKRRQTWRYQDWEIALDNVEGLGEFVEIEYSGSEDVEPKIEAEKMIQFLKDQGCGRLTAHSGYPFLLLFPEERDGVEL